MLNVRSDIGFGPPGGFPGVRAKLLPFSLVIPTRNRAVMLQRMLASLAAQSRQPAEIVIVDASDDHSARLLSPVPGLYGRVVQLRAATVGAAAQRNQGVAAAQLQVIGFCDDDILLEDECIARLWQGLRSDPRLGGISAMIVNQRYQPPGKVSRLVFAIMAGRRSDSFAGKIIGPAVNLLPEDRADLPEVVEIEWLNTTCTLYRREALPHPPFGGFFTGYSMMEDLALSASVARYWKLANARTARIFHDSQPGDHKRDVAALSRMELVNRHHVMTALLDRRRPIDYARLALWEAFQLAVCAVEQRGGTPFWCAAAGKLRGLAEIIAAKRQETAR